MTGQVVEWKVQLPELAIYLLLLVSLLPPPISHHLFPSLPPCPFHFIILIITSNVLLRYLIFCKWYSFFLSLN